MCACANAIYLPNRAADLEAHQRGRRCACSFVCPPRSARNSKIILPEFEKRDCVHANGAPASSQPCSPSRRLVKCIDPGVVRARLGVSDANTSHSNQTRPRFRGSPNYTPSSRCRSVAPPGTHATVRLAQYSPVSGRLGNPMYKS